MLALGLPDHAVADIARRVAIDSMPAARRAILEALSMALLTGEMISTSACARAASLDRKVARMTLEELAAIGVVHHDREHEEADEHQGTVRWSLAGEDGELIAEVFGLYAQGGWDETWVYTSTSRQIREGEAPTSGGRPTLRPTFATAEAAA
jgi:hypothetical protein